MSDRPTGRKTAVAVPGIVPTIPLIMVYWVEGWSIPCVRLHGSCVCISMRAPLTDCTDLTSIWLGRGLLPGIERKHVVGISTVVMMGLISENALLKYVLSEISKARSGAWANHARDARL